MCTDTSIVRKVYAVARVAPNARRPCVCVLDEDGHRISLLGDELSKHSLFFQTMSVKACGVRTTPATAYAFRTTSAGAYAFQTQSVKAYFFQTQSVKAYFFQTQSVKAYFFQTTSVKACGVRTTSVRACAFQTQSVRAYFFQTTPLSVWCKLYSQPFLCSPYAETISTLVVRIQKSSIQLNVSPRPPADIHIMCHRSVTCCWNTDRDLTRDKAEVCYIHDIGSSKSLCYSGT